MDPLSTTAGIIAVLQISSDVIKYILGATGATKERRRLREEILACESVLLQLQDTADDADGGLTSWEKVKALDGPDRPLFRLQVAFEAVKAKLEHKKGLDKALSVFKWPFDEREVEKLISVIQREKSLLQLALTKDCWDLIREVKRSSTEHGKLIGELVQTINGKSTDIVDSVRELRKHQINLEHQAILGWLTPVDYVPQQSDFINRRQAGTGEWLLDSPEFHAWLNTKRQTLFCPGIPGTGKTILTSIVVNDLCNRFHSDSTAGIAYTYCNFRRQDEQRAGDLLASLLKQLAQGQSSLPDSIRSLYQKHKNKRTRPLFDEVTKVLQSVAAMYLRLFIVVDALDECQISDGCRSRFLTAIFDLQAKYGANIFVTSRSIPDITEKFQGSISLEIRASEQDVRKYVNSQIPHLPSFVRRNSDLQEKIKSEIVKVVDGMFLLAQLYIHSLIGKRSPKSVLATLAKLLTGSEVYNQAYRDAMERIKGQATDQEELAKQVLYWITCAKRPLTTTELQLALAVEVGELELDQSNFPQIEDMVSVCAGLVTVDEKSGIIRLVHYTAQEYLKRTQKQWFPNAEIDITRTCLTYLSFGAFESGFCQTDDEFEERLRLNQLYDYAAHNWGHHACAVPMEMSDLTIDFLQAESKVSGSSQTMMAAKEHRYRGYSQDVPRHITSVHLAACFGLLDTIVALLGNGNEPDPKDTHGRTPLSYAAERGHEAVVAMLLAKDGVNPDSRDSVHGWTPLWYAIVGRQATVVNLLLEKEAVNPDSKSKYGRTPLSWAVENGHEAIIKLLLEKNGVDPNSKDSEYGRTPLSWAVANGHDIVVKLLLDKAGVHPDSKDSEYGRTPLSWAAEKGHKSIVEALIAKDSVDLNSKSRYGRTPLWFARERGHKAIVKLLLANNRVDPSIEDHRYQLMPLWQAAEMGQEAMVKFLLQDGVEPNSKCKYKRTPLSYAAERGHEVVVKLLLEENGLDPDLKDPEYGRTPLSWAAANGHEAIVKLLLEDRRVNPDSKSKNLRTPLSWAARFGYETVVKLLVTKGKVDLDSKSSFGRTPLSYAAERGHDAVVKLLVEEDSVDLNSKDSEYGRTPLLWAAANGHDAIVKLLLNKIAKN